MMGEIHFSIQKYYSENHANLHFLISIVQTLKSVCVDDIFVQFMEKFRKKDARRDVGESENYLCK